MTDFKPVAVPTAGEGVLLGWDAYDVADVIPQEEPPARPSGEREVREGDTFRWNYITLLASNIVPPNEFWVIRAFDTGVCFVHAHETPHWLERAINDFR